MPDEGEQEREGRAIGARERDVGVRRTAERGALMGLQLGEERCRGGGVARAQCGLPMPHVVGGLPRTQDAEGGLLEQLGLRRGGPGDEAHRRVQREQARGGFPLRNREGGARSVPDRAA